MSSGYLRRVTDLVAPGGLAVAFLGFGLTRFVVAGSIAAETTLPFAVAVVPLVAGLAFTLYGVVLAVGDLSRAYVRTVVRWTFLGASSMALVLAGTALGLRSDAAGSFVTLQDSQFLVSNALLAGAIGGALTGDRAGVNRRNRNEVKLQAELALIANELLRHEVLNATAIIDGYTSLFDEESPRKSDVDAIRAATDRIEETVSDVGEVGRAREDNPLEATGVCAILREEAAALGERYPDSAFRASTPEADVSVLADRRLRLLVRKLLETVAERGSGVSVIADVGVDSREVSVSVSPSAAEKSPDTVETTNDDPAAGFDRRIVELLTEYYGGRVEFHSSKTDDSPSSAVLYLPRATGERATKGHLGIATVGVAAALFAGLTAGVAMGVVSMLLTGLFPVIGALYGVPNALVGWITHLFHSVVFALLFVAGYTHFRPDDSEGDIATVGLLGAGWGVVLWVVAAGFLMPLWLRLVGVPAPVPDLTGIGLLTHVVWGVTLGPTYLVLRRRFEAMDLRLRSRTAIRSRLRRALG